jgi:hypothetical protein
MKENKILQELKVEIYQKKKKEGNLKMKNLREMEPQTGTQRQAS